MKNLSSISAVVLGLSVMSGAQAMPTVMTRGLNVTTSLRYHFTPAKTLYLEALTERFRNKYYLYQGMQFGSLSAVMPTDKTSPKFNVTTYAVDYTNRFH